MLEEYLLNITQREAGEAKLRTDQVSERPPSCLANGILKDFETLGDYSWVIPYFLHMAVRF